jgi:hypothetical protein
MNQFSGRCISGRFFDDDREPPYRFVGCITWSVMTCLLDGFWPPLAVTFWIRRHGKWRKRQTEALTGGRRLNCRERVTLKIKLNDAFRNCLGADRIGMGMETFVPWHPGAMPRR